MLHPEKGRKMFAAPLPKDTVALLSSAEPEQRLYRRYPIRLELQYKMRKLGLVKLTGSGRTVNISRGGVFFESDRPLPEHGEIDLVVNWPFLLDDACPLKLIVRGRIVRSDKKGSAVRMRSYDFRTSKRSAR